MADIDIRVAGPARFEVTVADGAARTNHRVAVPAEIAGALPDDALAEIVRRSFDFLLAREPATSILSSFDLDVIGEYFPAYGAELRRWLGELQS